MNNTDLNRPKEIFSVPGAFVERSEEFSCCPSVRERLNDLQIGETLANPACSRAFRLPVISLCK